MTCSTCDNDTDAVIFDEDNRAVCLPCCEGKEYDIPQDCSFPNCVCPDGQLCGEVPK